MHGIKFMFNEFRSVTTSEPAITWDVLSQLHKQGARATASVPFQQHRLLNADQFGVLCGRTGLAAHLGNGQMQPVLEALHRLRLVVPLFVSPKGSDRREVASLGGYEPWSTHGSPTEAGGWTELYYHPFQLWLVDIAARVYFMPWNFGPTFREGLAERRLDMGRYAELALQETAIARKPSVRQRQARFYAALPALVLADATVGPDVRGMQPGAGGDTADSSRSNGHAHAAESPDRRDATWQRWSRKAMRLHASAVVARDRARIHEFAREAWSVGEALDPLRRWGDLTGLARWDQREQLEGSAFAAHRIKELALLLGELLGRVDGLGSAQQAYDPDGVAGTHSRGDGQADRANHAERALVIRRYGLTPTPAVTWFVTSKSEQLAIAAISAARGRLLERHGIVVSVLESEADIQEAARAVDFANRFGTLVFVLSDRKSKRVRRWAQQLRDDGRLDESRVLWSEPNFEKANFTKAERRDAKAACQTAKGPESAAWLTERFLLPELSRSDSSNSRPIVEQLQTVLDAALAHDAHRPR